MDSLLANYASSDEEEEQQQQQQEQKPISAVPPKTTSFSNRSSSLFPSLPQPKSSSLFQSIPPPKQSSINPSPPAPSSTDDTDTRPGTSLFSFLPKPKSQIKEQPKKVVQFKPPIIPFSNPSEIDDEDDKEEEEQNRRRKLESSTQAPSVKSFLSSIPAPRNTATLGVQASSGSGRRSIVETEAPEPAPVPNSGGSATESNVTVYQNAGDYVNYENYGSYQDGSDQNPGSGYVMDDASYGNYSLGVDQSVGVQPEGGVAGTATSYNENNEVYASYNDYGQYENNWVDGSASGSSDNVVKFPGKRGRHEMPSEIVEVNQEELIKNRPREDQVKLTGIAFGPSYQPVSTKGKPSKLHKRKHQIGSLYFDMKQRELELAERRARGMLTKAETQAKYGW